MRAFTSVAGRSAAPWSSANGQSARAGAIVAGPRPGPGASRRAGAATRSRQSGGSIRDPVVARAAGPAKQSVEQLDSSGSSVSVSSQGSMGSIDYDLLMSQSPTCPLGGVLEVMISNARGVSSCGPDETLEAIIPKLSKFSGLPVIDASGQVVGVLSRKVCGAPAVWQSSTIQRCRAPRGRLLTGDSRARAAGAQDIIRVRKANGAKGTLQDPVRAQRGGFLRILRAELWLVTERHQGESSSSSEQLFLRQSAKLTAVAACRTRCRSRRTCPPRPSPSRSLPACRRPQTSCSSTRSGACRCWTRPACPSGALLEGGGGGARFGSGLALWVHATNGQRSTGM